MTLRTICIIFGFLCFVCFSGCKTSGDSNLDDKADSLNNVKLEDDHTKKVKKIFYNVPSPLEMATLLQHTKTTYHSDVLNSVDNASRYITVTQMALNFGVYGADLSYTRMFDQIQECVKFLSVLRKLSDGIGIPETEGKTAINRLEDNIENRDSVIQIVSETYSNADVYLKENERGNTAVMIILGGWIEALYIACNITDEKRPDTEIMNRIGEQKFSLNNLIDLINTYKDDATLTKYASELGELQTAFEKVDIVYTKGDVLTDKVKKLTTIQSTAQVKITIEQVKEIKRIVSKIRNNIVK